MSEGRRGDFGRLARTMRASLTLRERMDSWEVRIGTASALTAQSAWLFAVALAAAVAGVMRVMEPATGPNGLSLWSPQAGGLALVGLGVALSVAGLLFQASRPIVLGGDGRRLYLRTGDERAWSHAYSDVRDVDPRDDGMVIGFADGSEEVLSLSSANARLLTHWVQTECWGAEGGEVPRALLGIRRERP